jgi:hypothetical protein
MIRDNSRAVIAAASLWMQDRLESFARLMVGGAKHLSPVDTGHNRDSVTWRKIPNGVDVHTESGYGGWLEIGTQDMAARPYFRPAFEETRVDMKGRV